jgi:hypothetical protein
VTAAASLLPRRRSQASSVVLVVLLASASAPGAGPATSPISIKLFPEAPERPLVIRACAACHAPELVVAKRHTVDEWDDIIAKMVDRGAVANEDEQQQILEYLARFYGPE